MPSAAWEFRKRVQLFGEGNWYMDEAKADSSQQDRRHQFMFKGKAS